MLNKINFLKKDVIILNVNLVFEAFLRYFL